MPEESVVAYNNNIISFVIFLAISFIVLLILVLQSRIWVRKTTNTTPRRSSKKSFKNLANDLLGASLRGEYHGGQQGSQPGDENLVSTKGFDYPVFFRTNPYWLKGAFLFAVFFIFAIFFIFIVTISFDFSQHPMVGGGLFLILILIFFLGMALVYLVKSKVIE
ncbi:MAG: hypothetical protein H5T85_08220 [Actinobacteria bacterium]|nr:hypothetical protein [Actinomycetota bacterium]